MVLAKGERETAMYVFTHSLVRMLTVCVSIKHHTTLTDDVVMVICESAKPAKTCDKDLLRGLA